VESWIVIIVALVAAAGSVAAALVAARSASAAKHAELQAARIRELENRLATAKSEVYEPMIELLRTIFDATTMGRSQPSQTKMVEAVSKFGTWIQIYGSDEAVRAFHRFMQAAYTNPPPEIIMRFYAELILETRRDLGYGETSLDLIDILGIRFKDVYAGKWPTIMSGDRTALYAQAEWAPPWAERYG
jgi:hypothetical protein